MSKLNTVFSAILASLLLAEATACITKEKAEKKAKKEVAGHIEYSRIFTVFAASLLSENTPSSFFVYFLDKKGVLKGRDRISADGKDKSTFGRVQAYADAGVFDTAFFDTTHVRDFFNKNQQDKFSYGFLVIAGELEMNAPQPCWRIIDVRGTEWYYTITGKIFNAEKFREEIIQQSSQIKRY